MSPPDPASKAAKSRPWALISFLIGIVVVYVLTLVLSGDWLISLGAAAASSVFLHDLFFLRAPRDELRRPN
ncbi:MAG TPA: hypothetical protein VF384_03115 [Planctomycetota bacterium]